MPDVMIATKTGVLRGPDGQQYRITRGRTTAHSTHPAVAAEPSVWVSMPVNLAAPGSADVDDQGDDADRYAAQLQRLADGLRERGIEAENPDREGWVVDTVLAALDRVTDERNERLTLEESSRLAKTVDELQAKLGGSADHEQDPAERNAAIREWAAANDVEVSPRGKIPQAVVDRYEAAVAAKAAQGG